MGVTTASGTPGTTTVCVQTDMAPAYPGGGGRVQTAPSSVTGATSMTRHTGASYAAHVSKLACARFLQWGVTMYGSNLLFQDTDLESGGHGQVFTFSNIS